MELIFYLFVTQKLHNSTFLDIITLVKKNLVLAVVLFALVALHAAMPVVFVVSNESNGDVLPSETKTNPQSKISLIIEMENAEADAGQRAQENGETAKSESSASEIDEETNNTDNTDNPNNSNNENLVDGPVESAPNQEDNIPVMNDDGELGVGGQNQDENLTSYQSFCLTMQKLIEKLGEFENYLNLKRFQNNGVFKTATFSGFDDYDFEALIENANACLGLLTSFDGEKSSERLTEFATSCDDFNNNISSLYSGLMGLLGF